MRRLYVRPDYFTLFPILWQRCSLCGHDVAFERMYENRSRDYFPVPPSVAAKRPPHVTVCRYCCKTNGKGIVGAIQAALERVAAADRISDPEARA